MSTPEQAPKHSLLLLQTTAPAPQLGAHLSCKQSLFRPACLMQGLGIFYGVTKIHIHSRNSFKLHVRKCCTDYEIILFEFTAFIRIYDQNVFITKICIEQTWEKNVLFVLPGSSYLVESSPKKIISWTIQTNISSSKTWTIWFLRIKYILQSIRIWEHTSPQNVPLN